MLGFSVGYANGMGCKEKLLPQLGFVLFLFGRLRPLFFAASRKSVYGAYLKLDEFESRYRTGRGALPRQDR